MNLKTPRSSANAIFDGVFSPLRNFRLQSHFWLPSSQLPAPSSRPPVSTNFLKSSSPQGKLEAGSWKQEYFIIEWSARGHAGKKLNKTSKLVSPLNTQRVSLVASVSKFVSKISITWKIMKICRIIKWLWICYLYKFQTILNKTLLCYFEDEELQHCDGSSISSPTWSG